MQYNDFYISNGLNPSQPLSTNNRIKFNRFVFNNLFLPKMEECKSKNTLIELNKNDIEIIKNFVIKKVPVKTKERNGIDDKNIIKRETTGACVEYAFLKLYGLENKFDTEIVDHSYQKSNPDLLPLGIACDIKGSSIGNVPLVFKQSRTYKCKETLYAGRRYRCPNIFGITDHNKIWLLGIATPEILEKYVDDNLIIISTNSTKTGFYGVNKLINLPSSWSELKNIFHKIHSKLKI